MKLDGLDGQPHDLGSFGLGGNGADGGSGDWMHVATPAIQQRMSDFAGESVAFNLMAVVRDPAVKEHKELVQNVKAIQAYDTKLDELMEDWRGMEGAETKKDVVTGISREFGIAQPDIDQAELPSNVAETMYLFFVAASKFTAVMVAGLPGVKEGKRMVLKSGVDSTYMLVPVYASESIRKAAKTNRRAGRTRTQRRRRSRPSHRTVDYSTEE